MHVLFTGGGTLGSVTPLMAVAEELRSQDRDVRLSWIGTRKGPETALIREAGIAFLSVSSGKLRRYLSFRNLIDPFLILAGTVQAFRLLGRLKPDIVVSAGGFVAVPVIWAAGLRRIPVHIHQLDLRPGLANRLSLPFVTSMTVSHERSLKDYAKYAPEWTGTPVRKAITDGSKAAAMESFGLVDGLPTLLVLGGGTGAATLNDIVRKSATLLVSDMQILHVTGKGKQVSPEGMPERYHQVEFLTGEMPHAYAVADVVVTRAGIGTLSELSALAKPTIIVPMPDSHQEENAALYGASGSVPVLPERSLFSKAFADAAKALFWDRERASAAGDAMNAMTRPDAAARFVRKITETVNER